MKTIDTLVEDIYDVVDTRGGWDAAVTEFIATNTADVFKSRLEDEEEERTGALRMSSLGRPCHRQLWYQHNVPRDGERLPSKAKLKFLYGDMVELLLLSLAMAAGHEVRGTQGELDIAGIKGHRDAVIDGVTIDVKSASPFSFRKFKEGLSPATDGFGYLGQLEAYTKAGHRADNTVDPFRGGFLAIDKVSGDLCLDVHSFSSTYEDLEHKFESIKAKMDQDEPPARAFEAEDDGYKHKTKGFVPNGNKYLGFQCAYCEFKKTCWPTMRTFLYKGWDGYKPKHFVKVVKMPKAQEVDNAQT